MRKKIALFLAAIMVVGTLPMTAFAKTDNEIDRVVTVQDGAPFDAQLIIDDIDTKTTNTIKLVLTNAEWASGKGGNDFEIDGEAAADDAIDQYSKTKAFVTFAAAIEPGTVVIDMALKAKGEGEATITIEDVESDVTEETLKIANIVDDATITTIDGTTSLKEGSTEIEPIVIEEVVPGSIEAGTLKVRLAGGFEWDTKDAEDEDIVPEIDIKVGDGDLDVVFKEYDGRDAYFTVSGATEYVDAVIVISGLFVEYDEDDVAFGTDCEAIVSGAGVDKTTLLVGTATDYAVAFTVEDEDLKKLWAGEATAKTTLEMTIEEKIADSWIHTRKAKITLPEGIKVVDVDGEDFAYELNADRDVMTIEYADDVEIDDTFTFDIIAAADYEGDVEVTLSGTATGADDQTVVVATVAKKWAVEADTNELIIDYRNTEASDIVITEAEAGLWEKGQVIALALDKIDFEGKPSVTVEEGDMKIKNVEENNGVISFEVKQESIKEAAVIRISGIELYMGRSLAAGEYDLSLVQITSGVVYDAEGDVVSYVENDDVAFENDELYTGDNFDVDEITVCEGYVTIVTAGREQDDSTFTTKVVVTIGAETMTAGSKVIALDVPAFIDGGYTMLPVRAVAESLSDAAIVKWDDATKTVTIFFGQRVISMTIGSKVMVINGVDIAMSAAPVIVNGRTFLPLRDLGYALGLNEDKIAWDDATKTATLN